MCCSLPTKTAVLLLWCFRHSDLEMSLLVTTAAVPTSISAIVVVAVIVLVMESSLLVVMAMVVIGMRSLAVGSQNGWRTLLLYHISRQPPQNDTDPTFSILLGGWQGIDTMLPSDVNVATKRKDSIVGLGKIHAHGCLCWLWTFWCVGSFIRSTNKGQLSRGPERNSHGNILLLGTFGIKGCRIVMKGFPIAAVLVPIKPRSGGLGVNVEIVAQLGHNFLEFGGLLGRLANQMSAFVPRNEVTAFHLGVLQIGQLLHQLIVSVPIVFGPKQFGHNHHIVVLHGLVEFGEVRIADKNADIGSHQGTRGIKTLRIAPGPARARLFGDALTGIVSTRIVLCVGGQVLVLGLVGYVIGGGGLLLVVVVGGGGRWHTTIVVVSAAAAVVIAMRTSIAIVMVSASIVMVVASIVMVVVSRTPIVVKGVSTTIIVPIVGLSVTLSWFFPPVVVLICIVVRAHVTRRRRLVGRATAFTVVSRHG